MKILLYLQCHATRWKRSEPTKAEKKVPKQFKKNSFCFSFVLACLPSVHCEPSIWWVYVVVDETSHTITGSTFISSLSLSLSHTHISTNFVGEVQQCDIHSEQGLGIGGDPRTPPSSLRSSRLITRHNPNTSGNTSRFSNINNYIYNFNITYH